MFTRIFSCIFAFLVSIFPWLGKYEPKLNVTASVEAVITAIKEQDIDTIEAFMCKNIKDNTADLREEIENLLDLIDGEITSHSLKVHNDFYMSTGGKSVERAYSNSIITTTITTYYLDIRWEIYNNYSLAERGIRWIGLYIKNGDVYELLTEIGATEHKS